MTDALLEYKPDVIYSGRSFLEFMCAELERRGVRPTTPKLVVATNEMIREGSRELIRRHFGVDLTESYGSVEMGVLASDTPARDGLRLCEDLTFFERREEGGTPVQAATVGRILVPALTATLMPFIRYEQGERVLF